MYALKTKKGNNKKRRLIIGLSGIAIAVGAFLLWYFVFKPAPALTPTGTVINYGPPTDEEKQAGDDKKQEIVSQQAQNSSSASNSGQKKVVTPVITSASDSEVSAYVPSIFEEGGTCTATYTQSNNTVTKTSQGFGNASYTQCSPFAVSTSDFPSKGTWNLIVSYSSATAEGKSQLQQVEVK